ncbi:uncharacterized protein LOC143553924 [Bidens hawaiensis]|uniref:uncharacterized protein LOC143553924 n=1 Tax=Bidens hawaiensis TaxID=980011 RepID=UPI0040490930
MNLEEKKMELNNEFDLNTSTTHQSSEMKSSVTCNENQEENTEHIIDGGLSSKKLYDSFYSSFKNFTSEPEPNGCNPTETMDDFSVASDVLSSCGSFTTLAYDSNNEADVSCSGTGLADGVTVDFEDAKKGAVDSSVISGKLSSFPKTSRNKSYKKMIQDAFMSRKRLAKEYKQLAILYGDIDKELCQPTESQSSKQPPVQLQDGPDSEWELL